MERVITNISAGREEKHRLFVDLCAAAVFLAIAIVAAAACWGGRYVYLREGGDEAGQCAFAAAADNPGSFAGDELLGDPGNRTIYNVLHIHLLRYLRRITADYGTAHAMLQGPVVFLQLLGFYLLGIALFRSRYWALLLTAACASTYEFGGEYWGIWFSPLPRSLFQALLPYLLLCAWRWRTKPARWPLLMVMAGFSVFIHPVSGPPVGFGLWLALWLCMPTSWPLLRRMAYMPALGAAFMIGASFYFVGHRYCAVPPEEFDSYYALCVAAHNVANMSLRAPFDLFVRLLPLECYFSLVLAVGSWLLLYRLRRRVPEGCLTVLTWIGGVIIFVALSELYMYVLYSRHIIPHVTWFWRSLRFVFPWLYLFTLWPLAELSSVFAGGGFRNHLRRGLICAIGALFVTAWLFSFPPEINTRWSPSRYSEELYRVQWHGRCPERVLWDTVRDTFENRVPLGSTVMVTDPTMAWICRFHLLKPVIYSATDGGFLVPVNRDAARAWYGKREEFQSITRIAKPREKLRRLVAMARRYGAAVILTDTHFIVCPGTPHTLFPNSLDEAFLESLGIRQMGAWGGLRLYGVDRTGRGRG
ncbi:MAG: hypothetical protein NTX71_10430 [Candidatus Aureabacteria bacterium]|nr:hypothetical protein [Candidatus Auribacterota bacterium]